ncbi:cupredoxin domain-containing protein [Mycobacterium sp. 1274761.0]|uniref:cupredoxin domain-containing protein n=1 Tax=Mycobacterium sp. 1274761.0 TaxID=1834077 RepID=UPI0008021F3F|nr:cupredoxin domain-containing protein [Mycobacterium sp. 1274761.0]OBK72207.1 metal-binding protein [Mycobacterium sp. 1274761.0]
MKRIGALIGSFLLSAATLTACGGTNGTKESAPSPSPASPTSEYSISQAPSPSVPNPPAAQDAASQIVISNMAFAVPSSVKPGQQLTIVNKDDPNHTVTADEDNLFDIRVSGGGGTQTFTAPPTPGTYPFHCKYHADMHGLLSVQ